MYIRTGSLELLLESGAERVRLGGVQEHRAHKTVMRSIYSPSWLEIRLFSNE